MQFLKIAEATYDASMHESSQIVNQNLVENAVTDEKIFPTLAQIWLKMQMIGISVFRNGLQVHVHLSWLHIYSVSIFLQWFQKSKFYIKKTLHVNGKIKNRIRNALCQHNINKPVNVCQSSSFIDHQIKVYNILWHTYNPTINIILTNTLKIICLKPIHYCALSTQTLHLDTGIHCTYVHTSNQIHS